MDDFKNFKETSLPLKEEFYSKLNFQEASEKDFEFALKVWKEFSIKDMGEYHDLCLKTDALLLTDVFEQFRKTCLQNYELHPCWFYTAPGLSWDALLKHSKAELELLTDPDMLLFFEKGTRGGKSTVTKRFAKANNKYLEEWNPEESSKFLVYLDANALYAWAMTRPLPVGDFSWTNSDKLENWEKIPCVIEDRQIYLDLEYPEELQDLHNDYPLAPESLEKNKVWKLIPNLNDKEQYILHERNLELHLSLGMRLKKIHRGIKFREEAWMRSYIEKNTVLRMKANSKFEKVFFKLLNNSVFGKTMENIRKQLTFTS